MKPYYFVTILFLLYFVFLRNSKFIYLHFFYKKILQNTKEPYLPRWIFLGRKKINLNSQIFTFRIRNFLTRCIFFIGTIGKLIRSIRIIISQRIKKRFRRSVRSFMVIGIVRWLMLVSSGLCWWREKTILKNIS